MGPKRKSPARRQPGASSHATRPQPSPREKAAQPWLPWAIGSALLLAGAAVGWSVPALLLGSVAGQAERPAAKAPVTPVDKAAAAEAPVEAVTDPGMTVELIWVLQNTGNTTWTPHEYRFAPAAGGGALPVLPLPSGTVVKGEANGYIKPGEMVTLIARLNAPAEPGTWQPSWQLTGPRGPVPGGLIRASVTVRNN